MLVRNLGANPPLKFGGPKPPNFGQFSDDIRLRQSTAPERNKISLDGTNKLSSSKPCEYCRIVWLELKPEVVLATVIDPERCK